MTGLYQLRPIEQKARFTGPERQQELLGSFRLHCLTLGDAIAASTPAGPCATYPMNDSWTERVAVPGVVLIADVAGWNDPIIGEGAVHRAAGCPHGGGRPDERSRLGPRRVRGVRGGAPGADAAPLHRFPARDRAPLRLHLRGPGPAQRLHAAGRRRPDAGRADVAVVVGGPEPAPPEAFADANIERIFALA